MAAGRLAIEMQRNEDWSRGLTLRDDAGEPIDIGGASFRMQVRYAAGAPIVIAEAEIEVVAADSGEIDILLRGADFDEVPGTQERVTLAYDLRAEQDGEGVVLMRGPLYLSPEVTAP